MQHPSTDLSNVAEKTGLKSNRVEWMDVLRGIGMLLVILGHVSEQEKLVEWIYAFHMPLFFFISGWLYRKQPIKKCICRKTASIVVPYLSFGVILLVYWTFVERVFRPSNLSAWQGLLGLLLGREKWLDFNIHLWFLPCLFIISVMYNVLMNVGKRNIVIILALLSMLVAHIFTLPQMLWSTNKAMLYIGYFALGDLSSDLWKNEYEHKINAIINFAICVVLWLLVWLLMPFRQAFGLLSIPVALIGIAGGIALSLALKSSKLLQHLGKITLVILCIHGPVYRVLLKVISLVTHTGTPALRKNLVVSLFVTAVVCVLCAIVHQILNRFAPWMIGHKKSKLKT